MERIGGSRRFAAAILDFVFTSVLVVAGMAIYVGVGGSQLAMEAQNALGRPVTWQSVTSEEVWVQYERRVETMADDMERMIRQEFTDEQAEFIGRTLAQSMEEQFVPDRLSVDFFLEMDETDIDRIVDEAFDSVNAAGRSDIPPEKVNALRDEVKATMREFGVGTIVPRVIDFVIWLLFLPAVIILVYGFIEGIFGRSPGKLITGIAIRREDGERAYAGTYLARYAVKNSPFLLVILALLLRSPGVAVAAAIAWIVVFVGILVMLGPDRRAIYDYIAGTAVYQVVPGENRE